MSSNSLPSYDLVPGTRKVTGELSSPDGDEKSAGQYLPGKLRRNDWEGTLGVDRVFEKAGYGSQRCSSWRFRSPSGNSNSEAEVAVGRLIGTAQELREIPGISSGLLRAAPRRGLQSVRFF